MPRIRCNYEGCIHLEGNLCSADEIELDQELGCLTFSQVDEEVAVGVEEELEDEEALAYDLEEEEEEDEDEEWEDLDEDEDDDWEDDDDEDGGSGWSGGSRRAR
jgi:hypothetical protein